MTHRWGLHWQRQHQDNREDFEHIERMGYHSFKIFEKEWRNRDFCAGLLSAARKDALFIARDHPLSEQKEDMYKDPQGTGVRHAQEWAQKVREGNVHLPLERTYFQGINEPDSNHAFKAIDIYTEAYIIELAKHGLRGAGWVFGTGHPSTVGRDPKAGVDWSHYRTSAAVLSEHDGIACFHAYGAHNDFKWDNHLARWATCPYPLTAIIDEFGIDYGVVEHMNLQGWRAFISPEAYVKWLDQAQAGVLNRLYALAGALKVHSFQIFTFDHAQPWGTFDIRWEVARLMESYPWSVVPEHVEPPPPPKPPKTQVVHMPFVSTPNHAPSSAEAEENWQRCIDFVLGWEGGYVNDPDDPGGETKWGISKRAHPELDIYNLTREQAIEIYRVEYWKASGADKMTWPLCLVHFDAAVNSGVGSAQWWLKESNGNPVLYLALRLRAYTELGIWKRFGAGWSRRICDLMEVVA